MKNRNLMLFTFIFLVMLSFLYFYVSAFNYDISDLPPHIAGAKMVITGDRILSITPSRTFTITYPLFHILNYLISFVTLGNFELAAAILLCFVKISVILICFYWFKKYCNLNEKYKFLIIGFYFIIALPLTGNLYLPQGSPTVWHNPTYIMQIPFSIFAYFFYIEILNNNDKISNYFYLTCSLILSTLSKPSFAIVLIPGIALFTLFYFGRNIIRKLKFIFYIALTTIPSGFILIYQYLITFSESVETIIKFGTFQNMSIIMSVISTFAVILLPLSYLIKHRNKIKNKVLLNFSWFIYLIGWIQFFFLSEKGYAHGNFAWGYYMSIFLLYFATLIDLGQQESSKFKTGLEYFYFIQIFFGIIYFLIVFTRGGYLF